MPGTRGIGCPGRERQARGLVLGQIQQVRKYAMALPDGDFPQRIQQIRGVTGRFAGRQRRQGGGNGVRAGLSRGLDHKRDRNEFGVYDSEGPYSLQPRVTFYGE